MEEKGLNFPPVKVLINNEICESPDSEFLRSIALFDQCLDFRWEYILKGSKTFQFVLDRIRKLGNSGEAQVSKFYEHTSLGYNNYEDLIVNFPNPTEPYPRD